MNIWSLNLDENTYIVFFYYSIVVKYLTQKYYSWDWELDNFMRITIFGYTLEFLKYLDLWAIVYILYHEPIHTVL